MRKSLTYRVVVCAGLGYATTGVHAETPITGCPEDFQTAAVNVTALVSTNLTGCPSTLRQKTAELDQQIWCRGHSVCLPGSGFSFVCQEPLSKETVNISQKTFNVIGSTESAQRFFPEALAVNPSGHGVFLTGLSDSNIPFASAAAMTVASMRAADPDQSFTLDLVLSDRFTIN